MIGNTFSLHAVDRFLLFVGGVLLSLLKRSENNILTFAQGIGASSGSLEFDIIVTELIVLFPLQFVLYDKHSIFPVQVHKRSRDEYKG